MKNVTSCGVWEKEIKCAKLSTKLYLHNVHTNVVSKTKPNMTVGVLLAKIIQASQIC